MSRHYRQLVKTQKSVTSMAEGYRLDMVWFVAAATFVFSSFFFSFFSGGRASTKR